ncbi:type II toxin-antitoxin system Phd/YefM family antitoxin [Streptomyces sp. NPDC090445]|uniref:type II toxin-antitoxin system Phd/YefM family antitoxin n=1 Tax=Streptomyces sp. NPDC090445 TaxID=3365963 RepID=UPI00380B47D1
MFVTARAARKGLLPLIKKVNESHEAIEIVSEHGDAVLLSAEDYAALREGSHAVQHHPLQHHPAHDRRVLVAHRGPGVV